MNKAIDKIQNMILNPSKKDLIFLSIFFAVVLLLVIFVLAKANQPKGETSKTTIKITATPTVTTKKTTPTEEATDTPEPTEKIPTRTPLTLTPAVTSTPVPTDTPNLSPTPSRNPDPPKMKITFPTEGQDISLNNTQTFCVVDTPDGGDQAGLKRRQNLNGSGWSSYDNITTLCYSPQDGSNTLELQYINAFNEESQDYTVHFTFHRTN
jgi:hypothetical protein